MRTVVKIYVTRKREWHWQMFDFKNKRKIGASSEGYKNRHQLLANLERVTGVSSVPWLAYGTKTFEFEFDRDINGDVVAQTNY